MTRSKFTPRGTGSTAGLTLEEEATHFAGPVPPRQWEPSLRRLVRAWKARTPGPSWWAQDLGFFGTVETHIARTDYWWDGMKRLAKADPPFFFFQFTFPVGGLRSVEDFPEITKSGIKRSRRL